MSQIVSQYAFSKVFVTCCAALSIGLGSPAQASQADQAEAPVIEEVVVTAEFRPMSAAAGAG
jgi:hypothetical protein